MDHKAHNKTGKKHLETHSVEYVKFAGVLALVTGLAWLHADRSGLGLGQFLESFMGVFFLVFAAFKIYNLKEFAYGFKSYEIMKNKSIWWGYTYPFVQVTFGLLYLLNFGSRVLDGIVFVWSAYGAYVVLLTLRKKGDIHCVCLGNVVKLPLSTTSFVEDFGMSAMALVMFILR